MPGSHGCSADVRRVNGSVGRPPSAAFGEDLWPAIRALSPEQPCTVGGSTRFIDEEVGIHELSHLDRKQALGSGQS